MKDETGFRQYLRRAGKKDHVVDGLVRQVLVYEAYLADAGLGGLEETGEAELLDYAQTLDARVLKKQMRALALYYKFKGDQPLARLASELREQEIARTRQAFKLRDFRGVDLEEVEKLEAIGVVTVEDMLAAGRSSAARERLAEQTEVSPQFILELVKLSDLSRLGAVKAVRARLYYDAGLDTPEAFKQWEPDALRQMLIEFVDSTGFDGIAPLPKELRNAIQTARKLPQVVQY